MCLYERILINPKYLPNEKNGGIPPKYKDLRTIHIRTGCGWCSECRKEIANNWKIRINEELKENKNAIMVTLTFSEESIKKLEKEIIEKKWKGINGTEIDINMLAAYAVRMWSERWRKKQKKAPRHFLITELGETASERIHLHGIIWNATQEEIERTWKYGHINCGQWVDERTINYIIKYVTKNDTIHKGYKQRIFVSKGIGKNFIEKHRREYKYNGEKTKTWYRNKQGLKMKLPKYYKQKLWNEEERENIWINQLNQNTSKIKGIEFDLTRQDEEDFRKWYISALESARETDKRAKFGDNKTLNEKYLITGKMKGEEGNEIQKVKRREIKRIKKYDQGDNGQELGKNMYCDTIILGDYIGTTTETERKRNEERHEAEEMGVDVRTWRLFKKGIIKKIKKK